MGRNVLQPELALGSHRRPRSRSSELQLPSRDFAGAQLGTEADVGRLFSSGVELLRLQLQRTYVQAHAGAHCTVPKTHSASVDRHIVDANVPRRGGRGGSLRCRRSVWRAQPALEHPLALGIALHIGCRSRHPHTPHPHCLALRVHLRMVDFHCFDARQGWPFCVGGLHQGQVTCTQTRNCGLQVRAVPAHGGLGIHHTRNFGDQELGRVRRSQRQRQLLQCHRGLTGGQGAFGLETQLARFFPGDTQAALQLGGLPSWGPLQLAGVQRQLLHTQLCTGCGGLVRPMQHPTLQFELLQRHAPADCLRFRVICAASPRTCCERRFFFGSTRDGFSGNL